MADPIPLSAPDGTVYAYACGECSRVVQDRPTHPSWQGHAAEASVRAGVARDSHAAAVTCCQRCGCGARGTTLCDVCEMSARRALRALACIGMASAAYHIDPLAIRVECCCEPIAALCGVSPETVRWWRT